MDDFFETIFNSVNDGIAIYNYEGHFLEINHVACQYFGYSRAEMLQMKIFDMLCLEHGIAESSYAEKLKQKGKIVVMAFRHKNGSLLHIELSISTFPNDEEKLYLAVFRGTNRKLMEMELEKNREQLMLVVKGSNDGIWDWDLRDNSLYLSPQCKEMIGYEDHELPNTFSTLEDNIHPDDRDWVLNELEQYLHKESSVFKIEFRATHKNGGYIWTLVRGVSLRDENGNVYRMTGSATDITALKLAEIQIAEEAVRRRVLIEQSYDGIVVIDQNGKVFEANQKYAKMLGYSSEEILNLHIWDWDIQFSRENLLMMVNSPDITSRQIDTRIKRKDGTLLDVEISSNSAILGGKHLTFCVCRDVTARKQQEKALLSAKQEAESSSIAKSEFIANMSHELRTPLTSIIGFSDILDEKLSDKLGEKQLEYVRHINKSGKQLLQLINDLLDISIIESGNMGINREWFSIQDTLDEISTVIAPLASGKHITLNFKNNIGNEQIFVDETKFKQIMYNLLNNAIKFTPDYGTVSVVAKIIHENIRISVSDNGIGIPGHNLVDIFNPFTQVDSSSKRRYSGTGLGLAIVKQLIEMHKGHVWVKSEEGKGSTFELSIPME